MAVVQTNSNILSNLYGGTPQIFNPSYLDGWDQKGKQGTCAVTTTDSVNSQYRLCRVNSGDVINNLFVGNTALGGTAAIKFGLYEVNSTTAAESTAGNTALFAAAVTMTSAIALTDYRFSAPAITTLGQRVWELLGLSSDPKKDYDLCGTLTVVAGSNGTLAFRVGFVK